MAVFTGDLGRITTLSAPSCAKLFRGGPATFYAVQAGVEGLDVDVIRAGGASGKCDAMAVSIERIGISGLRASQAPIMTKFAALVFPR